MNMSSTKQTFNQILYLNDSSYITGGASKVAIMEANEMARRGKSVSFLACDSGQSRELSDLSDNVTLYSTGQRDILNAPILESVSRGIRNSKAIQQLSVVLEGLNPSNTVVHLHSWEKALSAAVVKTVYQYGFKLVYTLHEYITACPNGSFYNHQKQVICKLKPMSARCVATHCDSRSYAHKVWRVARHYSASHWYGVPSFMSYFIFPSQMAREIVEPYLPDEANVFVVPNGIDCTKTDPVNVARNTRLVFVGRLSPEKGVGLFLEACKRLEIRPLVVGEGPLSDELMQRYPDADYVGWHNAENVRKYLSQARALVFPSIWYEVDPLILREAMSLGIPVITSDACAGKHSVVNESTGLHFISGDVADLMLKLSRLQSDSEYARVLGGAAYDDFWNSSATIEKHCDQLEGIYDAMFHSTGGIMN